MRKKLGDERRGRKKGKKGKPKRQGGRLWKVRVEEKRREEKGREENKEGRRERNEEKEGRKDGEIKKPEGW